MKRQPQLWIVKYRLKGQLQKVTSPLFKYKWEVLLWLKDCYPMAEIVSIESWRPLAAK
jgi:hypothetical protein